MTLAHSCRFVAKAHRYGSNLVPIPGIVGLLRRPGQTWTPDPSQGGGRHFEQGDAGASVCVPSGQSAGILVEHRYSLPISDPEAHPKPELTTLEAAEDRGVSALGDLVSTLGHLLKATIHLLDEALQRVTVRKNIAGTSALPPPMMGAVVTPSDQQHHDHRQPIRAGLRATSQLAPKKDASGGPSGEGLRSRSSRGPLTPAPGEVEEGTAPGGAAPTSAPKGSTAAAGPASLDNSAAGRDQMLRALRQPCRRKRADVTAAPPSKPQLRCRRIDDHPSINHTLTHPTLKKNTKYHQKGRTPQTPTIKNSSR